MLTKRFFVIYFAIVLAGALSITFPNIAAIVALSLLLIFGIGLIAGVVEDLIDSWKG